MLATETAEKPVKAGSTASVKRHIWTPLQPVNRILHFSFNQTKNPRNIGNPKLANPTSTPHPTLNTNPQIPRHTKPIQPQQSNITTQYQRIIQIPHTRITTGNTDSPE